MKSPLRYFIAVLVVLAAAGFAHSVGAEQVRVILVEADNSDQGVEDGLQRYAGNLQHLFRFNSYRQVTRKTVQMDVPGEAGTKLPGGQSLKLRAGQAQGPVILTEVTWIRDGKRLVHTRIQLRYGAPAVLGGPRSGRESIYLMILELE